MSPESIAYVRAAGVGMWVPDNVLTNAQIIKKYGLNSSDEWVRNNTGIEERHINDDPKLATSDMAAKAGFAALQDAGVEPNQIDMIIVATTTPDYPVSATAQIVKEKLKIKHAAAFDLNAGCSGFIYGMTSAAYIEARRYRNILLIGADMLSTVTNWKDRNTCFIFADGAGAMVLSASEEPLTKMHWYLDADGKDPSMLNVPSGGSSDPLTADKLLPLVAMARNASSEKEQKELYEEVDKIVQAHKLRMRGHEVFEKAVDGMIETAERALDLAQMTTNQIRWFLPHQANLVIIKSVMNGLGLSYDKGIINIQKYGNTSAATIPIALTEYDRAGKIGSEDDIDSGAFGAGLTMANIIFRLKERSLKAA